MRTPLWSFPVSYWTSLHGFSPPRFTAFSLSLQVGSACTGLMFNRWTRRVKKKKKNRGASSSLRVITLSLYSLRGVNKSGERQSSGVMQSLVGRRSSPAAAAAFCLDAVATPRTATGSCVKQEGSDLRLWVQLFKKKKKFWKFLFFLFPPFVLVCEEKILSRWF